MSEIIVIDAPCGYGKTTNAINSFLPEEKYIYVTPFLDEVERLINNTRISFVQPVGNKLEAIQRLMAYGQNIATTHASFTNLSIVDNELINEYHLVIDEAIEVVSEYWESGLAIKTGLVNNGYVGVEEDGRLFVTDKWEVERNALGATVNNRIYHDIKSGCLYLVNNSIVVWQLPPSLLLKAKSVTILTYMFNASLLSLWLEKYGMKVEHKVVDDTEFRAKAKSLLTIESISSLEKVNFSFTGQKNFKKDDNRVAFALGNLKKRHLKGVDVENIYITCAKDNWFSETTDAKGEVKLRANKVFSRGSAMGKANWVANNARATNEYAHCTHAIYLYDKHVNQNLPIFLGREKGFNDAYALSELIQWLWRGCIRKGEPMTVFIPSKRMRSLLLKWLEA